MEEALRNADSRTDLQLRIKPSQGVSPITKEMSITPDLTGRTPENNNQ